MARTFIRQATQIRKSDLYDDTIAASLANFETNPVSIEDDLNSVRSQLHNMLKNMAGNWWDDLNTPVTLDPGTQRGVNDLNTDLHLLERKRVLVASCSLVDVAVTAAQNWEILSLGELPSNTIAAVGAVTTRGTVAAFHSGTFGTHSLDEAVGASAIAPKNLCEVVDGATRDPILSLGRVIYALFQTETATDGHTMTGTTPTRAQLSFVRINAAGDDLEAVPVADIENKVINVCFVERTALEDLNEQDFLRGAVLDVPAGTTVTRQVAYDNQGTTPVDLTTNATLDLEGAGLVWAVRDDLQADLFRIIEGSVGGTSQVSIDSDVDTFNVDAQVNDFDQGIRIDTGGQRINIGETAGLIESTGVNDLRILGAGECYLDDGNQTGSTWVQTAGIKLSDTTVEWDNFETAFGEVSLLRAIAQSRRRPKVYANVTSTTAQDTDVGGVGGGANLDVQLPDMSVGDFLTDYDVFLNGELQRPGANSAANNDYYPGTSLANGQLRFEFVITINDVICCTPYARYT